MRLFVVAAAVFALGVGAIAGAKPPRPEYGVDVGHGAGQPLGGDVYSSLFDVGYREALHFRADFQLADGIFVGPTGQFGGRALYGDGARLAAQQQQDLSGGRLRLLVGGEVRFRFRSLDLWVRFELGLDAMVGHVDLFLADATTRQLSLSSSAFTIEPTIGWSIPITRYLDAGLAFSFPLAVNHRFYGAQDPMGPPSTPLERRSNAGDLDVSILVGTHF